MQPPSGFFLCVAFASACGHSPVIDERARPGSLAEATTLAAASSRTVRVHPDLKKLMTEAPDQYRGVLFWLQITLARFGYLTRPFTGKLDSRTVDAIVEYRRHAELGGEYLIDKALFDRMDTDGRELDEPTWLPDRLFVDQPTLVTMSGTWVGIGEQFAYAFNHVEIECRLVSSSEAYCAEAEAHVGTDGPSLSATVRLHEVEKWTKNEIVTVAQQAMCAKDFIRVNRVTEEVTRTRVTTNNTDPVCAKVMIGADFSMRLEDGDKIWRAAWAKRDAAHTRVLGLPAELFTAKKRQAAK